jgi:hypothetical protein
MQTIYMNQLYSDINLSSKYKYVWPKFSCILIYLNLSLEINEDLKGKKTFTKYSKDKKCMYKNTYRLCRKDTIASASNKTLMVNLSRNNQHYLLLFKLMFIIMFSEPWRSNIKQSKILIYQSKKHVK